MAVCPACGAETPDSATDCPSCHLAVALFPAGQEAAGSEGDPTYLKTVAELLQSVEETNPPSPPPSAEAPARIDPAARFPSLRPPSLRSEPPTRTAEPLAPLEHLPALPPPAVGSELRRRAEEYVALARRLGVDFSVLGSRLNVALLTSDEPALEGVVREMFVHLVSALVTEYDTELARRNEVAQHVPTPAADVELEAIHRALALGDTTGAHRRLVHVRDELERLEEEWATGRILLTECELLEETIQELGGDPSPAHGPLVEGRRALSETRREPAERLLARAARALWVVLEPKLLAELKRLRDRLLEERAAGTSIAPALGELRAVVAELHRKNFAGAIGAFRRLRATVDAWEPVPSTGVPSPAGHAPSSPSADN